jgi:hypothetical protein
MDESVLLVVESVPLAMVQLLLYCPMSDIADCSLRACPVPDTSSDGSEIFLSLETTFSAFRSLFEVSEMLLHIPLLIMLTVTLMM